MKTIDIPDIYMEYPIGGHMKVNYAAFVKMAELLFEHADKQLKKVHYVSLLCRGSSGAIAASIFYQKMIEKYPHLIEVRINHVKKEGEKAHSGSGDGLFWMDNRGENTLYIIVDDFSNTGSTLYAIYDEVGEHTGLIDFVVLKYVYQSVLDRMKKEPIAKVLIAKVLQ